MRYRQRAWTVRCRPHSCAAGVWQTCAHKRQTTKGKTMKEIIAGALFILAAGTAQAQGTRFYIGADVAKVKTNVEDKTGIPPIVSGEADATTLRLKGGAHFTSWFDLELQLLFPSEET